MFRTHNRTRLINEDHRAIRKLAELPFFPVFLIFLITAIGIVMMYSASRGNWDPWASKQIVHFSIFFPLMLIISIIDIRFWYRLSYLAYFGSLGLLLAVEIYGHTAMGATRWINLGFMKFQPSDLMKLSLILALARYFHNLSLKNTYRIIHLIIPIFFVLAPCALIMKQPDLGTAMILLFIGGTIFFLAGVKTWKFASVIGAGLISMPIIWNRLHDYQKARIITFLDPDTDPLGAGYNIIQSKIAIGSGGLFGKGLLKGTQSQLNFLPEHQTDFIFTMFSEEFGFFGCTGLIVLYIMLVFYGFHIALNSKNHFGRILASGSSIFLFVHVIINMSMVSGLLPVVGVPLPLLSYGGTIMMTILISFGFLFNVYIHRRTMINPGTSTLL